MIFFPLLAFSGCTESDSNSCDKAIDGSESSPGWSYTWSSKQPIWAIFELAEETAMNQIVIVNGRHKIITFKVTIKANNQWSILTGLSIREDANAQIGSDDTITLTSAVQVLHLDFNFISNVQSIRLDVTKTDFEFYEEGIFRYRNLEINEIIPKFLKSKSSIYIMSDDFICE